MRQLINYALVNMKFNFYLLFILFFISLASCNRPFYVNEDGILIASEPVKPESKAVSSYVKSEAEEINKFQLGIVCTVDGGVHGVDLLSNKEKWSVNFGGSLVNSFNSIETTKTGAVVPGDDGMLYIYSKKNQLEQYDRSIPELVQMSPMIQTLHGGHSLLVVGERNTKVMSIDPITGEISLLSSSTEGIEKPYNSESDFDFFGSDSFDQFKSDSSERIILGRVDYHVRAFDEVTSQEVWNFTYGEFELLGINKEISNILNLNDAFRNPNEYSKGVLEERITYNRLPISALFGVDIAKKTALPLKHTVDSRVLHSKFNYQANNFTHALTVSSKQASVVPQNNIIHVLAFNHTLTQKRQVFASKNNVGKDLYFHLNNNHDLITYTLSSDDEGNDIKLDNTYPLLAHRNDVLKLLPFGDPASDQNVCPSDMTGLYTIPEVENSSLAEETVKTKHFLRRFPKKISIVVVIFMIIVAIGIIYAFQLKQNKILQEIKNSEIEPSKENGFSENFIDSSTVEVNSLVVHLDKIKGRGGNGTVVYEGKLECRAVAVKRILKIHQQCEKTYSRGIGREIEVLIKSDGHPNVVRYFTKEVTQCFVYLALELCEMSLDQAIALRQRNLLILDNHDGTTSQGTCFEKTLVVEIADAVRHLHESRIIHRDIKPQNVLVVLRRIPKNLKMYRLLTDWNNIVDNLISSDSPLTMEEVARKSFQNWFKKYSVSDLQRLKQSLLELSTLWFPKLSDMGLSKIVEFQASFGQMSTMSTNLTFKGTHLGSYNPSIANANLTAAGTQGWRAPELLCPSRNIVLTKAVDIFALGNLVYFCLSYGNHPFGIELEREQNVLKNDPKHLVDAKKMKRKLEFELVSNMISFKASNRLKINEVLNHISIWEKPKINEFLCTLSGRLKLPDSYTTYLKDLFDAESSAYLDPNPWLFVLNDFFKQDLKTNKHTYDFYSSVDLLRFYRNKSSHLFEADNEQKLFKNVTELVQYFSEIYPNFVIYCFYFALNYFANDQIFYRFLGPSVVKLKAPLCNKKFKKYENKCERNNVQHFRVRQLLLPENIWTNTLSYNNMTATNSPKLPSKASLCKHFERTSGGWCPKGKSCGFAHGVVELKTNSVFNFDFK